jgi:hypothetical protein
MTKAPRSVSMARPRPVPSRLSHCTSPSLGLVAAPGFRGVMGSRLFGLSRTTCDTSRPQAAPGPLASGDGPPWVHGSATPHRRIAAGWCATAPSPSGGPPRPGPAWEARAPHARWASARWARSPRQPDGVARALLPLLAAPARRGRARGLVERQPGAAGGDVLEAAGLP